MNSLQVESQENFQTATGMSRDIILVTGKPGVGIDLTITACKKTSTQSSSHAVKTTKSFHCSVAGCGKVFTSSNHLKVHQRIHTGEKPFICSHCQRPFSTGYGLKTHERTHTDDKPYQCLDCTKAFRTSSDLLKHSRTHTGEKPFKCPYKGCGKYFRTSNATKVHERQHTGEKPYECKVPGCGQKFSNPANYKAHERIHTGAKPYQCLHAGCNKTFTEYSSWYKHRVVHSEGRPYGCDKCGKQYRQVSTLASHKRNCHSTELPPHIQLTLSQVSSNGKSEPESTDRVEVLGTTDIPIDSGDIPDISDNENDGEIESGPSASKRPHIDVTGMAFPLSSFSDSQTVNFSCLYSPEVSVTSLPWSQRTQECAVYSSSQASLSTVPSYMFVQSSPTSTGFSSISTIPTATNLDYIQSLMPTPQIASVSGNSIFSSTDDTAYHQSFVQASDVSDVMGFPVHSLNRDLSHSLDATAQLQVDAIVQQLSGSQALSAHQLLASATDNELALAMRNGTLGLPGSMDTNSEALLSGETSKDL